MSDPEVLCTAEFTSAVETLRQLLPAEELHQRQPSGSATIYTTLVTLWMMTLQRLNGGQSLLAVVKEVLARSRAWLPDNKRLREGTLSETSGAYAQARQRLQLETVEFFADRVCASLMAATPPCCEGRRAFLLDGTTITLAPTAELRAAFPPATNQHGASVWPVALLLVAHELQSGCALPPAIGAMYGDNNTSEAQLTRTIAERLPARSIVLADAGFGIFSVAHVLVRAGHQVLFRLTKARFRALRRAATLREQADGHGTWHLRWRPSVKDRQTNPDVPAQAELAVQLHEVPLADGESLYLVTNLAISSVQAGQWYARRYDVEQDIRDGKVTLDIENLRAKSVVMVKKELLTSLVAYNLVVQFRRQAAKLAGLPPRRLSFTGVWNTFRSFLLTQPPCGASEWTQRYEAALRIAARDKLPNRPGRSHPRRAHPRRAKSTKFMKQPAATTQKHDEMQAREKPK